MLSMRHDLMPFVDVPFVFGDMTNLTNDLYWLIIGEFIMSNVYMPWLATCQSEREHRIQDQTETVDWLFLPIVLVLAIPFFLVFAIFWTLLMSVIVIASLVIVIIRQSKLSSRG